MAGEVEITIAAVVEDVFVEEAERLEDGRALLADDRPVQSLHRLLELRADCVVP